MTSFDLPEIKIDSSKLWMILKMAIIVSVFLVVAINVINAKAVTVEEKYQFVYCKNPVSNLTIIYPEGTSCDLNEEVEDEEESED